jgi:uncharacterized RDD family membrane protein YckC
VTEIEPGWYKDPVDQAVQRYWDGEGWVGDPIPADQTPPDGPPAGTKSPPARPVSEEPTPEAETREERPPDPVPAPPSSPPAPPSGLAPPGWPPGVPYHGVPYRGSLPTALVTPHGHTIAPLWTRFLARLVDFSAVLVLNIAVNGWFVYQWWTEWYPIIADTFRRAMAGQPAPDITRPERANSLQIVIILLAAALWFAYEVPATANSGQTLGKRLLGIKVVRVESPEPLGFGRAIRRWNPLGLSTLLWTCFGVGFLIQLVDSLSPVLDWPLRRALHDKWAGTFVVRPRTTSAGEPSRPPAESRSGEPS